MSAPYLKNPFLLKRGTTAKVAAYSGPEGELVIDTTKGTIAVQTGTSGGVVLARLSDIPNKLSQLQNDTNYVTLEGVKQDYMPKADAVSTFDVNGTTITYTKADGTTGTIVTQDTTYSAGTGLNLSNTTFSVASTAGSSALSWGTEVTLGTVGGLAIKAKLPANPNTDTHYTTKLIVGVSDSTANAAATNGNLYLRLFDNTTARNSIKLVGAGKTTVTSDANGVITISSSDANTTYSAGTGLDLSGTTFSVVSTAGTSTLAWNSEVTLGTVGGLAIKAKLPANPNTDKLVAQNIVSGNATYPILLAATADATANIGAKAVQFASGVKINPSTATITATTFDGTASRAVADANGKNIATTYAAKTEVPTKLSQLSNDTNFVAQGEAATKATNDENGNAITSYIRELSVSGRVITYTKGDNTTGTITTQDTNTDTLVAQNISTANAAYPILLGATADATANIGNKAALFASGVKVNPSTSTITATTFNGTATRATADANGKNIANTYAAKTAIPTKLSQLSNDTNFVAQGETATNATNDANGNAITGYIKNLSVSGKVITFTKGDNTTGTITTQDTNTDTLVAQNVSTANSTYPILLAATADATANIGAKAVQFASGVKVNPSTSTITATTFNGTATKATADANGKNIANTYATKTEVTSLRDGIIVNVTALPTTGEAGKIYFLANSSGDAQNAYDEYAWVNNAWESLGPSTLDLAEYSKKNQTVSSFAVSGRTVTFTRADGTTGTFTTQDSNTWTAFKGATTDAAGTAGYVPAPAKGAANRYFRSDGTWQVPPNTWTAMVGATSSANGSVGYVNAVPPKDGYNTKYLRADGAWVVPPNTNTTYSAGTGLSLSGTTFSVASTAGTSALSWNTEVTLATVGGMAIKAKLPANPNTNTWIAFVGATTDAAGTAGYVPAPAAGAANRYFRSDGTWQVPPNTTYSNMTAATASAAGKAGLVPAPAAGKQTSFLRGDGTWVVPTNTTYSAGTGLSLSGTTFSVASTAGTSTLAWNTEVTLGTVGGLAIKAKLPANPNTNTDTLVTQNVSTTNAKYPLLLCPTADATANQGAKTSIFAANVKVNPSTSELMTIGTNAHIRQVQGNFGVFWRNDGSSYYLLQTASGDAYGTYNNARPLTLNLSTGICSINGNAATVTGTAGTSTLAWNSEVTLYTVGGHAIKAKLPANPNTDTHWTTKLIAGVSDSTANAASTNGNTYLRLFDNSTARNSIKLVGAGKTTVTSDANGVITITSTDANTTYANMTGATADAAGKAGLVPAPAAGKQTSFLRGDGTWVVPTNTWTAMKGATSSANGTAGYVPAPPTAGYNTKYLRADGTWQVPPDTNTTYTLSSLGIGNVKNYDQSKAIKAITRSGTTFTYTCLDGTTGTFTQQDNNTTYSFTDKNVTLAWGTKSTIATVGGTDIHVTMPANPNTNTTYSAGAGLSLSSTTFAVTALPSKSTPVGNSLTYCTGGFTIGTANGNLFKGSSNNANLISAPENGTYYNSTSGNVQNLRLTWSTDGKYLTDIFASPNNDYLWHRNVVNGTAKSWRRLVEENVSDITAPSWNINIAGKAATATKLATARSIFGTSFDGSANVVSSTIQLVRSDITKGTNPSDATKYWSLGLYDKNGTNYTNNCLGIFETSITQAGVVSTYMRAITNTAGSSTACQISCIYDTANNLAYTAAPTPADDDNTTKIATTAWVQRFCGTTKKYLTSHQSLAGYLPLTTNVSELGRYIDMHYDNGTKKYDYDVRFQVNSQGTAAGGGVLQILAASVKASKFEGPLTGNADTATKIQAVPAGTSYVLAATYGNALVNASTTNYGAIWNAPTKNYRVACTTYPKNNDEVYLCYSVTNANISAGTNTVAKQLIWNADTGVLASSGGFSGNVTGNCSGSAGSVAWGNVTGKPSTYSVSKTAGTSTLTWNSEVTLYTIDGAAIKAKLPANPNTNWTTHLYVGASNGSANAATTNGATYLMVLDNSTVRDRRLIKGTGATTVTSDASGNITINSTDTNTKVTQNHNSTNAAFPVLLGRVSSGTAGTSNIGADTATFSTNIRANPSLGRFGAHGSSPQFNIHNTAYTRGTTDVTKELDLGGYVFYDSVEYGLGSIRYHVGTNNTHIGIVIMPNPASTAKKEWLFVNYDDGTAKFQSPANIMPASTGVYVLGTSGARWKEIWCSQNSINSTSDERIKTAITAIDDTLLDAWADVDWVQFKFKDAVTKKGNDIARFHTGLISQRISSVLSDHGLDPGMYGLYLYDKWDAEDAIENEQGEIVSEAKPAGDAYGLRYVEALCVEAAYQRRRADRAERRLAFVEERLAAIESKLDI